MSIEVHVRVRPEVPQSVWATADTVLYNTLQPSTRYVFNKVHAAHASNRSIFRAVEPLLHAAFDGRPLTVMAYGQTGSGKTHSMLGTDQDAGVIPRAARLLLQLVSTHPGTALAVSFTEIYNETVKDLLEPQRGGGDLALMDGPNGTVRYDKKLVVLEGIEHFGELQMLAERHRQYGVTDLNNHSSRSHMLLTFEIRRGDGGDVWNTVHLVDLAGSECASRANTEGQTLREGGFINKSLLALGNVVDALVEKRPHVPYRDAKLTRLLRNSFGDRGITFLLCCVHPGRDNVEQTAASLRFTQRAMKMKGDPVIVLPIPPLFTHQYAKSAQAMCEGSAQASQEAFERGLRDSYLYCSGTLSSIVVSLQSQVAETLHTLAGMQRLLVAHDHALAMDALGRLYEQVHAAQREEEEEAFHAQEAQQALQQVEADIDEAESRLQEVAKESQQRTEKADFELADWEHKFHAARQQQVLPDALLMQQEMSDRLKIEYEWLVCVERIAGRFVPVIVSELLRGTDAAADKEGQGPPASPLAILPPDWRTDARWEVRLQEQLARERRAVLDLEAAQEIVQEDMAKAAQRKADEESMGSETPASSPQGGGSLTPAPQLYPEYPTLAQLDQRIDELEHQEQVLHRQLRYNTHRYSLRRIRSSLTPPVGRAASGSDTEEEEEEEERTPGGDALHNEGPSSGYRRACRRRRRRRLEDGQGSPVPTKAFSRATVPISAGTASATIAAGASAAAGINAKLNGSSPSKITPAPSQQQQQQQQLTPRRPQTSAGRRAAPLSPSTVFAQRISSPSPLPLSHPLRTEHATTNTSGAKLRSTPRWNRSSRSPLSRRRDGGYSDGVENAIQMLHQLRAFLQPPAAPSNSPQGDDEPSKDAEEDLLVTTNASSRYRRRLTPAGSSRSPSGTPPPTPRGLPPQRRSSSGSHSGVEGVTLYELYLSKKRGTSTKQAAEEAPAAGPAGGLHTRLAGVVGRRGRDAGPATPPQRPGSQRRKENCLPSAAGLGGRKDRGLGHGMKDDSPPPQQLQQQQGDGTAARALWSLQANTEQAAPEPFSRPSLDIIIIITSSTSLLRTIEIHNALRDSDFFFFLQNLLAHYLSRHHLSIHKQTPSSSSAAAASFFLLCFVAPLHLFLTYIYICWAFGREKYPPRPLIREASKHCVRQMGLHLTT
eukprot:gene11895-8179_t